jgi:para-aminobenzoate synthetase component 1
LGSDGWLQSSIAIRTLEILGDQIYCWGGGGIVHESEAGAEYQETLDKVGVFMRSLNGSEG